MKVLLNMSADDTTLMAESEEELKSLLMKMKEESEKVDLKLNIQKTLESPLDCKEIQPVHCSMSSSNTSCPPYKFLRRKVRWSGILISLRIFQFVMIHTIKGLA